MSRVSTTVAIGAAAALVFVLALAGYLLVVSPKSSRAEELDEQIAQRRLELAEARRPGPRPQEAVSVADLFRLTKAMPDEGDMPGTLVLLARLARQSGLTFQSITRQEPVAATDHVALPTSVVLQGTYRELTSFLARLRGLVVVRGGRLYAGGRLFTVSSISLAQGLKRFPQLQATLTVESYVFGAGAGAPAAGGTSTTPATTTTSTTPAGGSAALRSGGR